MNIDFQYDHTLLEVDKLSVCLTPGMPLKCVTCRILEYVWLNADPFDIVKKLIRHITTHFAETIQDYRITWVANVRIEGTGFSWSAPKGVLQRNCRQRNISDSSELVQCPNLKKIELPIFITQNMVMD